MCPFKLSKLCVCFCIFSKLDYTILFSLLHTSHILYFSISLNVHRKYNFRWLHRMFYIEILCSHLFTCSQTSTISFFASYWYFFFKYLFSQLCGQIFTPYSYRFLEMKFFGHNSNLFLKSCCILGTVLIFGGMLEEAGRGEIITVKMISN